MNGLPNQMYQQMPPSAMPPQPMQMRQPPIPNMNPNQPQQHQLPPQPPPSIGYGHNPMGAVPPPPPSSTSSAAAPQSMMMPQQQHQQQVPPPQPHKMIPGQQQMPPSMVNNPAMPPMSRPPMPQQWPQAGTVGPLTNGGGGPTGGSILNGASASSSRTASPGPMASTNFNTNNNNRIQTSQMPPAPLSGDGVQNKPPQPMTPVVGGTASASSQLLRPAMRDSLTGFSPLKSSTPQMPMQSPPPSMMPSPIVATSQSTMTGLTQGMQGMNVQGARPPFATNLNPQQQQQQQQVPGQLMSSQMNGNYQQQPQPPPPINQQQQHPPLPSQQLPPPPPSASLPPTQAPPSSMGPMANRYPPMVVPPTQPMYQQQQQQQRAGMPPAGPGVFTGAQPPNMPMQYQNQMPPLPQQPMQNQYQAATGATPYNGNHNMNNQRMAGAAAGGPLSVTQAGFSKLWGTETVDLMQNRHILPTEKVEPPPIKLNNQFYESVNCSPDVFRCTLTKIPETKELLNKSRLPLGILIHPFRDINKLPVIQCSEIVRCRACRTYINPFVYFVDSMKWKCNLCYRVNDLPKEFQYDPITKTYGDVTRRPEVKSSTIEFIAPGEYMLRPPQPAIYLFLLDVSTIAVQSGYLTVACQTIMEQLDNLPGDARTHVGFVAYNSAVHFYNIAENFNQPHEITVLDVNDMFLPCPDNLLVNLNECKELVKDLLVQLPKRFTDAHDPGSSLGAALQAAFKLMSASGGRVTVFQTCLPNHGPGALQPRENPNNRSAKDVPHLGPATDFYKLLALECSGQQIAVDVFLMNSQYSDLATISGISKFSGGSIHHFPLFSHTKVQQVDAFRACLERYLTRKVGFEAVMRLRCTRGLTIHTFHGNFFVRSTDLLSLPNVNPDAGFGMQIAHEENLTDLKTVCFQAALLYTSSKGERRIRVHTLCLPVVTALSEVILSADSQAIVGMLSKMAVDRSLTSTLSDAREAFINATVDILAAFKLAQNLPADQVVAPTNLSLLPLYINAIMKHAAFRVGTSTRLDDRVFAMCEMKTLPLDQLMRYIYPDFYNIDCLFVAAPMNGGEGGEGGEDRPEPPRLQLSAERLDSRSMFLMDLGMHMMIYVGSNVHPNIVQNVFGVGTVAEIPDLCYAVQSLATKESEALFTFMDGLNEDKPYAASVQVIRDTSSYRGQFTDKFVDDRTESALSYYEFLQHLRTQIK